MGKIFLLLPFALALNAQMSMTIISGSAARSFANGYSYCRVLTFDPSMVSGGANIANFPVTVNLTTSDSANLTDLKTVGNGGLVNNSSGFDIGFYDDTTCSGAGSKLPWEMESYSASSGDMVAHVKTTVVFNGSGTKFSMYYGGAYSSFQGDVANTWNSNYTAIYHMKDVGSITDSIGTVGTCTNSSATNSTGQMDGSANFVGATPAYISCGTPSFAAYTAITVSAWFKTSTAGKELIAKWSSTGQQNFFIDLASSTTGGVRIGVTTNISTYIVNGTVVVTDGNWHRAALVWTASGGAGLLTLYVDGSSNGSTATLGTTFGTGSPGAPIFIGGFDPGNSTNWTGDIDELRISNTAVLQGTANWSTTEFRNQSYVGCTGSSICIGVGSRTTP